MKILRQLMTKPAGIFDDISEKCVWYEAHDQNGCFAFIALWFYENNTHAELHLKINRWSPTIAKLCKTQGMDEIRAECRKRGVKILVAGNPDVKDKRWPKFIQMMGFDEPKLFYSSIMEV